MKKIVLAAIAALCLMSEPVNAERFLPRGNKPNNIYGVGKSRQAGMTGMRGGRRQFFGPRFQARSVYGFRALGNRMIGPKRTKKFFGSLKFR